jgi:Na+-translocating ferredoxin:NAD+ oxidoreductase RnfG subunit
MGSPFEIMAYGEREICDNGIEAAFNEIARLERLLSIYREDSEISRINRGETSDDPDVQEIIALSMQYKKITDGAFDIQYNGTINLGAIGKGYAIDKAVAILKQFGITRAKISCRSTIYGLGAPFGKKGWPVTIEGKEESPILLYNQAISTSGNAEQFGHIIDPTTGVHVDGVISESIVSHSAAESDALSTAAFVSDMSRRRFLTKTASLLVGIGLTLFLPRSTISAVVYQTEDEALKKMFPSADRFETKEITLTADQQLQAEQFLEKRLNDAHFRYIIGTKQEDIIGYAFPMEVIGKERPITFLIGMTKEGAITSVEILIYRESQGSEIRYPRFMAQFKGKKKEDPLRMGTDIQSISGATLSSRGVTYGVRKALALFDVVRERK